MTTQTAARPQDAGPFDGNAFEGVVHPRRRPGYCVEPLAIAWDAVAFRLRAQRDCIACIPRAALAEFLDDLDAGRLDEQIGRFLASPPQGRVLRASDQTGSPGLFDELGSPGAIVPPERVPGRGMLGRAGPGTPADSRRNKNRRARGPKRALIAAGVVIAVGVVGTVALAATHKTSGHVTTSAAATAPTTNPEAAVTFDGKYDAVFTVTLVLPGKFMPASRIPALGSTASTSMTVTCAAGTCTIDQTIVATGPQFAGLVITTFPAGTDHLQASRHIDVPAQGACPLQSLDHSVSLDLQHDASGSVIGFTGSQVEVFPDGVDPAANCSSINVTYQIDAHRVG